jgi:RNA polymerase sigma-70 factor (ECF subfamily)
MDDHPKKQNDVRRRLLVLRCQTGDERAFTQLFGHFSPKTLKYLRGLLDTASADDVQQDVWLTVFRRISDLANPGAFRTWLYRITRHRALDHLRRENRRDLLLTDAARETTSEPFELETFDTSDVTRALSRLSMPHREVLMLRYWDELSYKEIASVIACSVGTVRSRIHHAKLNVRAVLDPEKKKMEP